MPRGQRTSGGRAQGRGFRACLALLTFRGFLTFLAAASLLPLGACGGAGAQNPDGGGPPSDVPDESVLANCAVGDAGEPTELRCTGLYASWTQKTLGPGVRRYDPGLHLWSDGAAKTRWIYLPPGTQIDTSDMNEWSFPTGTKLWKEFVVGGVRLETRMIWKRPPPDGGVGDDWYLTTYRWSADGTQALELTAGATHADGNSYEIPSQKSCIECHSGRADRVLGFEAIALSTPAAGGVTMAALQAENLLTQPPETPLAIPGDPTTAAALGYLHMNCGVICHNRRGGEAAFSGLLMRLESNALDAVQSTDTWATGVNVPAYFLTSFGQTQIFVPCAADKSAAYYRMSVRDGTGGVPFGSQMPPVITHQTDRAGLAALAAWLNGPACDSSR